MQHVHYVTSNLRKYQEASYILKDAKDWSICHTPLEIEEIQGTSREIIHDKASRAFAQLQLPLIVEDVSFSCPLLGGLPGPYIKGFLQALGPLGVAQLIHNARGKSPTQEEIEAEVSCHVIFMAPGHQPIYCVGAVQGEVVFPRADSEGDKLSWNSIFLPKGHTRTLGQMSLEEICAISMRKEALIALHECYRTLT